MSEPLKAELIAKKPLDMISIHESAITTTFEKTSDTQGTVALTTMMNGIDPKKLATILTKNQTSNITTLMEFAEDLKDLHIEYVSENKTDFRIKVDGSVMVKTDIPEEEIKNILTDKPFTQFRNLIKKIDGIQEASFTSKPFWASSFPQVSRILIEEK